MRILAVDPGPLESAYVAYEGDRTVCPYTLAILDCGKLLNDNLLNEQFSRPYDHFAIEQIRGYGLRVGNEVFDTCVWVGRFMQSVDGSDVVLIPRKTIVTNLCGNSQAGDKFVRLAIMDRFGGAGSIGNKKQPGPLYGVTGDMWSALAVALTFCDLRKAGQI